MHESKSRQIHQALLTLLELAERDPRLVAEMARARREFSGPSPEREDAPAAERAAAGLRFSEWYLLERESEVLGGVPLDVIGGDPELLAEVRETLSDSLVGVFRVEAAAGGPVRVEDLQDGESLSLELEAGRHPEPGDLLIGRLFSIELGGYVPSVALVLERDGRAIADALTRDLEGLQPTRRLSQLEIEHLLFTHRSRAVAAAAPAPPVERLEAELDTLLQQAGHHSPDAREISDLLREAERPGAVTGPLLERIAFETDADIEHLQRLLLQLWGALHARGGSTAGVQSPGPSSAPAPAKAPEDPPPPPGLGRMLADRIERGIGAHEGVDAIFADVERILGEKIEPDAAGEGPEALADGDLEGLVAEFLWETRTEHEKEAQVLGALVRQQRELPLPKVDVESLESNDLLRLLVDTYLRVAPAHRALEVQAAFAALERFFRWLETTHEVEMGTALSVVQAVFVAHVERVAAASIALSAGEPSERRGELWQVMASGAGQAEIVSVDQGRRSLIDAPEDEGADLRVGDLLLGTLGVSGSEAAAFVGMVVVLPPGVEPVLG